MMRGDCRAERALAPARLGSDYFTSIVPFIFGCRPVMSS